MARPAIVSPEQLKKVVETKSLDGLTDKQVRHLALVGAKALIYTRVQRQKRAQKVRAALAYYNAAQASGNVDTDTGAE
jgi:hypothetical protein